MSTNKFGIENILGKNKYLGKSIMTDNLQTTRWVNFFMNFYLNYSLENIKIFKLNPSCSLYEINLISYIACKSWKELHDKHLWQLMLTVTRMWVSTEQNCKINSVVSWKQPDCRNVTHCWRARGNRHSRQLLHLSLRRCVNCGRLRLLCPFGRWSMTIRSDRVIRAAAHVLCGVSW